VKTGEKLDLDIASPWPWPWDPSPWPWDPSPWPWPWPCGLSPWPWPCLGIRVLGLGLGLEAQVLVNITAMPMTILGNNPYELLGTLSGEEAGGVVRKLGVLAPGGCRKLPIRGYLARFSTDQIPSCH